MATERTKQPTGADTIKALAIHRAGLAEPPMPKSGALADGESVSQLDLDLLDDNPDQPRAWVDPDHLEDLAASILSRGTRQPDFPILVRPGLDGRYFVIAGHCRRDAKKLLRERATPEERLLWTSISALVRHGVDDETSAIMALDENIKRRDLTAVEEGASFASLLQRYPARFPNKKSLAKQLGVEETRVQRMIRLHEAPSFLREAMLKGMTVERGEVSGSLPDGAAAPRPRQERRRLEFKAGLEFLRFFEHLARQDPKRPAHAEAKAIERTADLVARALEEGWSFRKIEEQCAAVVSGKAPATRAAEAAAESTSRPVIEKKRDTLIVHLDRLAELSLEARGLVLRQLGDHFSNLPPATAESAGGHVAASGI